jgi:disulfide bond formation protein DsbB
MSGTTREPSIHAPNSDGSVAAGPSVWIWVSLALAVVALAGSLWLSVGMGLKACPLCFYQRTFVMAIVGILCLGLLTDARGSGYLSLLAIPSAVGGLGVAAYHVYLEATGVLECPTGVLGLGTAPQQSLVVLALLLCSLELDALRRLPNRGMVRGVAELLGVLFVGGAVVSSPPLPPVPTRPYEGPLEVCRPPYVPRAPNLTGDLRRIQEVSGPARKRVVRSQFQVPVLDRCASHTTSWIF